MKRVFPAEAMLFDLKNQLIDDLSQQITRLGNDWNKLVFDLAKSQFVSHAPSAMTPAQIAYIQSVGVFLASNIINGRKGWEMRSFIGRYSADVQLFQQDPMASFPYDDYITQVLAMSA